MNPKPRKPNPSAAIWNRVEGFFAGYAMRLMKTRMWTNLSTAPVHTVEKPGNPLGEKELDPHENGMSFSQSIG